MSDWTSYGEVVKKLGRLLRGLEEQGGFLSREEEGVWGDEGGHDLAYGPDLGAGWTISGNSGYGGGFEGSKVYALCEMVLEDLNNYAECMIPIGKYNLPSTTVLLVLYSQQFHRIHREMLIDV